MLSKTTSSLQTLPTPMGHCLSRMMLGKMRPRHASFEFFISSPSVSRNTNPGCWIPEDHVVPCIAAQDKVPRQASACFLVVLVFTFLLDLEDVRQLSIH